jgi:hypothetical protein
LLDRFVQAKSANKEKSTERLLETVEAVKVQKRDAAH